jgi:hypothetical protein
MRSLAQTCFTMVMCESLNYLGCIVVYIFDRQSRQGGPQSKMFTSP